MKHCRIFILLIKHMEDMTLQTEVPFDYEYDYEPGEPATYDYPGCGPEVRITKVKLNGVDIPLTAITSEMYDEMIEQVLDQYD